MAQDTGGRKSQTQVYGEVLRDIGCVTGGLIAGTVASYQIKKLAIKATEGKDGQATEPSLISKLSPTLVGAAATYGAVVSKDRGMKMFFVGMAAAAGASSLYNMAGNEITAKYAGQTLLGAVEDVAVLPTRNSMRYQAEPEDADYEDVPENEVDYEVNLPAALQTAPSEQATQYNQFTGFDSGDNTDDTDNEVVSGFIY